MVLVNKKMLAGGMAMVIVGLVLTININAAVPIGQAGMTEEEKLDLMLAEQENEDYNTLAGILFGLGFLLLIINAVLAFISFFTTSQLSCINIDENIKIGVQYGALGACGVHAFINLSFMILQPTNIFVVFISFLDACLGVGIVVLDVIVRREYTDFNNRLPEIQILISCLAIGTLLQRSGTRRLINKYKVNPKVRETVRPMNVKVNRPSSSLEIDGGDRRVIATYSP